MKTLGVVFAAAIMLTGGLPARSDELGELFPPDQMRDIASLDLQRINEAIVDAGGDAGGKLRRITIEFTSFQWADETWRHRAYVFLPVDDATMNIEAGACAIVSGFSGEAPGMLRLAESSALMGVPAVLVYSGNPGPRYGQEHEGDLMGFGGKKFAETGDPHWLGYPWLAKVIVRAATAAQAIPELKAQRFAVTGCSKRGAAAWIAAAADDRIIGAFPTCWNSGNVGASLQLKADRWGLDYQPQPDAQTIAPAFVTTAQQIAMFNNPVARRSLAYMDPYVFRDRLAGKQILYAVGTNDPLFPVVSHTAFLPYMDANIHLLLVPNFGHSPNSPRHRRAWRMWLAHCFAGRDLPHLEVDGAWANDRLTVAARVTTPTEIEVVRCWSTHDATGAYLDVTWTPTEMAPDADGLYRCEIDAPVGQVTAYFVDVADNDPNTVPGIVNSPVHEWDARTAEAPSAAQTQP